MFRHIAIVIVLWNALACSRPEIKVIEVRDVLQQNGRNLRVGDRVDPEGEITAVGGRAIVEVENTGEIRIFPATQITIDAKQHDLRVKLITGKVWLAIVRHFETDTTWVETANAVAGVRGTEFIVEQHPDETEVRVLEGEVHVEQKKQRGKVHPVKARQKVRVKGDAEPSGLEDYDPAVDRDLWNKMAALLKEIRDVAVDSAKAITEEAKEHAPEVKEGIKKGATRIKDRVRDIFR